MARLLTLDPQRDAVLHVAGEVGDLRAAAELGPVVAPLRGEEQRAEHRVPGGLQLNRYLLTTDKLEAS